MRGIVWLMALGAIAATPAVAETVRWTDESGQVHYTDEPHSVPAGQRVTITPFGGTDADDPAEARPEAPVFSVAPGSPPPPIVYEAPLLPHGFSYYVDTVLDTGVAARLLLDTGATFTIVSPEVGKRLGYTDLKSLPKMPVSTAGGGAWVYLIRIHRLAVGNAAALDIEGGISETLGPGMDGLLGGSFLNEFVYQIDGSGQKLALKPNRENRELYGGRDRPWWEMKYGHYVRAIRHYRELKKRMERGVSPVQDSDLRATVGMTPADMQKIIDYYADLHVWLERRAALAGVPKTWRQYP